MAAVAKSSWKIIRRLVDLYLEDNRIDPGVTIIAGATHVEKSTVFIGQSCHRSEIINIYLLQV